MAQYPGFDIATFTCTMGNIQNVSWTNVFYYQMAESKLTATNANQGAAAFHQAFAGVMAPLMSDNWSVISTAVRVFAQNSLVEGSEANRVQGSAGGSQSLPIKDCFVVQKKTGKFGRSFAGRWFFSGIDEELAASGFVDDNTRAPFKALANFCKATGNYGVSMKPVHWNKKENTFHAIIDTPAINDFKSRKDRTQISRSVRIP